MMPDAIPAITAALGRKLLLLLVLPASVLVAASNGLAQDEELLEWPGTLERNGHPIREVVFNVRDEEGEPWFESMIYADEPFEISDQRFDEDGLHFRWTPGSKDAVCRLVTLDEEGEPSANRGDYRGDCEIEGSGKKITLQISPPAEYKARARGDKKKKDKYESHGIAPWVRFYC